jgi:hypothetical protein
MVKSLIAILFLFVHISCTSQSQCYEYGDKKFYSSISKKLPSYIFKKSEDVRELSIKNLPITRLLYSSETPQDQTYLHKSENGSIQSFVIGETIIRVNYNLFYNENPEEYYLDSTTVFELSPMSIVKFETAANRYILITGTSNGCNGSFCTISYNILINFDKSRKSFCRPHFFSSSFFSRDIDSVYFLSKENVPHFLLFSELESKIDAKFNNQLIVGDIQLVNVETLSTIQVFKIEIIDSLINRRICFK